MTLRNAFNSCVKSWQYFRTHGIPLNSMSNSLSYDVVRFKIEVGIEEKFICKNVSKQTQHANFDMDATWRPCFSIDLDRAVNMLGLCDPSNLLLVLSTEERRASLKLLWGLVIIIMPKCYIYRVVCTATFCEQVQYLSILPSAFLTILFEFIAVFFLCLMLKFNIRLHHTGILRHVRREWALLSFHFVCLSVGRSLCDLQPTTIDRSQPNLVGRYILVLGPV